MLEGLPDKTVMNTSNLVSGGGGLRYAAKGRCYECFVTPTVNKKIKPEMSA